MSITKDDFAYRDLYSGLIRLHILHHAAEGPVFGLEMAEEPARHGYRISAGTLYPMLHGMEKRGICARRNRAPGNRFARFTGRRRSEERRLRR
jgi:DNA-binding PadR family transcriptional regulator